MQSKNILWNLYRRIVVQGTISLTSKENMWPPRGIVDCVEISRNTPTQLRLDMLYHLAKLSRLSQHFLSVHPYHSQLKNRRPTPQFRVRLYSSTNDQIWQWVLSMARGPTVIVRPPTTTVVSNPQLLAFLFTGGDSKYLINGEHCYILRPSMRATTSIEGISNTFRWIGTK